MPDSNIEYSVRVPGTETTLVATPTRVVGLRNTGKDEGINPKDKIGATKIDMTLLPVSAKIAWAKAQMDGGSKYGEYNWRVEPVLIRTYIGAAYRHLDSFLEGEDIDPLSLIEHLGHAMACCGIIIDAMSQGKAIDDRPIQAVNTKHEDGAELIREAGEWVKERRQNNV